MIDFSKQQPRQTAQPQTQAQPQASTSPSENLVFETVEIQPSGFRGSAKAATKLNDLAAVFVVAFVILAPLPLGGNHSLAWLSFAAAIAVSVAAYGLLMFYFDPSRPSRSCRYPVIFGLTASVIMVCAAQLLPIDFGPLAGLPEKLWPQRLTLSASATVLGLVRMLSFCLLFVLVLEICTNTNRTEWILRWIFYGIVFHAIWALISLAFLDDTILFAKKMAHQGYATGTFLNRNSFATFLSMGAMMGLGQLLFLLFGPTARTKKRDSLMRRLTVGFFVQAALTGIILAALLATGSRLGVVSALFAGLFLLGLMLVKTRRFSRRNILLTIIGTAVAVGLGSLVMAPMLAERLVFIEQNLAMRVELYKQSLDMIMQRPLLGYGLDSFPVAFELFHQPDLTTAFIWQLPHNSYLTLWAELGLIVGSIPILIIGICFGQMLLQFRQRKNTYRAAGIAAAAVVLCAVHSLGDFSLEMTANAYLLIVLTGLGISEKS